MLIMTQLRRLCNGFDICQSLLHGDLDSKMLAIERIFPVPIVVQPLVACRHSERDVCDCRLPSLACNLLLVIMMMMIMSL